MQYFLRQGAAPLQHPKIIYIINGPKKKGLKFGIFSSPIVEFSYARGRCPLPTSNYIHWQIQTTKGLAIIQFSSPNRAYKFSYTRGCCLGPLSMALALDPWAGLDPTCGFLRFVLDVSPSKQFLKVGSPVESLPHVSVWYGPHPHYLPTTYMPQYLQYYSLVLEYNEVEKWTSFVAVAIKRRILIVLQFLTQDFDLSIKSMMFTWCCANVTEVKLWLFSDICSFNIFKIM